MNYLIKSFRDFTKLDLLIWIGSVVVLIISFAASGGGDVMTLIASLIGVTSLIFIAKGNVIGQFMVILFAVAYSIISFTFHYYGEMVTYLCMTAPSALATAIVWIRNPYSETQVIVGEVSWKGWALLSAATAAVTIAFYFILAALETPNLFFSTISVTTSFLAAGLMFLRSQYYALGYMANDMILVVLWILASIEDISYLPMVVNFAIFFINDLYGYISWSRMKKVQNTE